MKRKTLIELSAVTLLVIVALFAWGRIASAERARLTPPPTATTLQAFAEVMPSPKRLALITDSGETKLVWVGDVALWSLPSGPACYVFNSSGKLVQWNLTTGDGEPTTELLYASYDCDELTIAEAFEFVGAKEDSQQRTATRR